MPTGSRRRIPPSSSRGCSTKRSRAWSRSCRAAGLKEIYVSGWQVAADANRAGQMYPDQSLYPVDSVPAVVRAINHALQRADQIGHLEHARPPGGNGAAPRSGVDWFAPIVADAEAGFGGDLNAFELMKAMIEAGAAG